MKILFYILLISGIFVYFLASYWEMAAWKCYEEQKFELEMKRSIRPSLLGASVLKNASLILVFTASSSYFIINQEINFLEITIHILSLFWLTTKEDKVSKFYGYLVPDLHLSSIISSYILGVVHGVLVWPLYNSGLLAGASRYFQNTMNLVEKFFDTSSSQNILILVCSYFACFISLVFIIAITSEGLRKVLKIERFMPWGALREYIRYWHAIRPGKMLYYDDFENLSKKIFLKHRRSARFSKVLSTFGGKMILGDRIYLQHAFTRINVLISLFISSFGLWGVLSDEFKQRLNGILSSLWSNLTSLSIGDLGSLASVLTVIILIAGIALAYMNQPSIALALRDSRFSQAANALNEIEVRYSEIYRDHAEGYLDSLVKNTSKSYSLMKYKVIPTNYSRTGFNFYQDTSNGNRWTAPADFINYDGIYESVSGLDEIYGSVQNKSSLWEVRRFFTEKNLNFGLIEYGQIFSGYSSYGKLFPDVRFSEEKCKNFHKNLLSNQPESYYFKQYRDFIEKCEQEVLKAYVVLFEVREALAVIGKSIDDDSRKEKISKSVKS